MPNVPLVLDGSPLTIDAVVAVAREGCTVTIDAATLERVARTRAVVDERARGDAALYGVNTGFGSLARQRIDPTGLRDVQRNLLRSHAAGVGPPLSEEVVRGMLFILAASLARARSGVRPQTIQRIVDLLNERVTPVVPSRGSVGASGDLAPLAHATLVLIGEGRAIVDGVECSGADALRARGLAPIELEAKEGLALINGTHMMCAIASIVVADLRLLTRAANTAAAMAIDACRATDSFLDERLHAARNQPGQSAVAAVAREQLRGSTILRAHRVDDPRVQDPYCLRAFPQVLGAAFDAIDAAAVVVRRELGAVTDNPLVLESAEGHDIVSGGNFHGMPLAIALDTLKIALCHVAGIAERRVYWVLAALDSENPITPHLSPQPGLHSGLMIVQYTAAACCNELQTLATPASVANIPTSAGTEDYNSMGATSAHQARAAVEWGRNVIAIELLVMSEALEYQRPLRSGVGVERAFERVRSVVPRLTADRPSSPDIAAIARLIAQGDIG